MKILQIVPRLAPALDGVGDYSLILAQRLRTVEAIDTEFLVCDPAWDGPDVLQGFNVTRLGARTPQALVSAVDQIGRFTGARKHVLLQYVSYGYQKRGCPLWLLRGLEQWSSRQDSRLHVMFHELEADDAPPWNSAYWLCPLQRRIIKNLGGLSTTCRTNAARYRMKLLRWGLTNVESSPTFSNVGEPSRNSPVAIRSRQVVVFGRPWQRQRTYIHAGPALKAVCAQIEATHIADIGGSMDHFHEETVHGVPIRRLGKLPAEEISKVLSSSVASFLFYPEDLLTKSGVYAASCSHGAIPFVLNDSNRTPSDSELTRGLDYVLVNETSRAFDLLELEKMSDEIFHRYQGRNAASSAATLARSLAGTS